MAKRDSPCIRYSCALQAFTIRKSTRSRRSAWRRPPRRSGPTTRRPRATVRVQRIPPACAHITLTQPYSLSQLVKLIAQWLAPEKSLREQGVDENEIVVLKKKFFFSDQNIDRNDPVQLNLLYVQVCVVPHGLCIGRTLRSPRASRATNLLIEWFAAVAIGDCQGHAPVHAGRGGAVWCAAVPDHLWQPRARQAQTRLHSVHSSPRM